MKLVSKVICASLMLAGSMQVAVASDTTWDFSGNSGTVTQSYSSQAGTYAYYGNSLTATNSAGSVNVTAWSDTDERYGDDVIQSAYITSNSYGLLSYNRNGGYGEEHTIDNIGDKDDTDMVLFEFADAVSLTSLNIGWTERDSDLSIAAFSSLPTLGGSTWAQVASNAIFTASFSDVGTGVLNLSSVATEAKYWLIGAYNRVFGGDCWSEGNDGFKILALTTHTQDTPPDEVSAPATGGLMAMLFGMMLYRRRMK